MAVKYKLNRTLYRDEDYDIVMDWCDKVNGKNEYPVFAKAGQIFTIHKLNEELREEYGCYDEMWQFIAISKTGGWILFQEDDENLFDWFDKIGE